MSLATGTRVGRYEVREPLGKGGMGEVYLARDVRLGRRVALKMLLPEYTKSRAHLRRFEQEARAASALNHPNILTVYEVGRARAAHFIAAEFVEGETLRRAIRGGRLGVAEALDVAAQVAAGLDAAHKEGVVHRDIKPENVMLRRDGYVKVLDFGLAKLTEGLSEQRVEGADESTVTNLDTTTGAIIGTVSYMSPEQLRGMKVDARTDIWSLGVVLYEMLARRAPFEGATSADVIVAVLEREPPPLETHAPECPPELARVVSKALAKDREARHQTAAELLEELRRVRRALEADGSWARLSAPALRAPRAGGALEGRASNETSGTRQARRTAGQNQLTAAIRRHKRAALVALLTTVLLAAVGLFLFEKWRAGKRGEPFRVAGLTKLVETGKAVAAAISPDGKIVVYALEDAGVQSLWTRQVAATGNPLPIVARAEGRFLGLTFSRDGDHVFYVVFDDQLNQGVLYQIPMLGGTPRKLLENVDTAVTFSPGGERLAFVRGYPEQNFTALMIANADGTGERQLARRPSPDDFGWKAAPAFSPDGRSVACAVGAYESGMGIAVVNVEDGSQRELTERRWATVGRVEWTRDGSSLLAPARDKLSAVTQVWQVTYPEGEARQVTQDLSDYSLASMSLTNDARSLVVVPSDYNSSIWLAPSGGAGEARQVATGKSDGLKGLSWTPDGRLVYASSANGNYDVWLMNADGTGQRPLTNEGSADYYPSVSPDGRSVAFASNRTGTNSIWRVEIEGGGLKQLTTQGDALWPQWSPDGRWVYYKTYNSGKRSLWRVPAEGGEPAPVSDKYSDWPAPSPDGRQLACMYWDEQATTQAELAILPAEGGPPLKTFRFSELTAQSFTTPNVMRWTPDGKAVAYIDDPVGNSNVVAQPLAGGPPRPLTAFKTGRVFWFDLSRDGRLFALARGTANNDVVLIKGVDSTQ